MTIGTSNRTLGKHVLLNRIVGREVGILTTGAVPFIKKQFTFLDLCAGDGRPTYQSGKSSPEIITKHSNFLSKAGIKNESFFIEKNQAAFDELKKAYSVSMNMNALDLERLPNNPPGDSAAFIHADPNLISDWPVSNAILQNAPEYTTFLATLGCNVGGLKRLPLEQRKEWFGMVDNVLEWMPNRHDAMLVALSGDCAQWSYLIVGPKKWHDEGRYIADVDKAFSYWEAGRDMVRFRQNEKQFMNLRDVLFLTKKEMLCR